MKSENMFMVEDRPARVKPEADATAAEKPACAEEDRARVRAGNIAMCLALVGAVIGGGALLVGH